MVVNNITIVGSGSNNISNSSSNNISNSNICSSGSSIVLLLLL